MAEQKEITWGWLSMRQQEFLRDMVLGKGAVLYAEWMVVMAKQLASEGLCELIRDEGTLLWLCDPTDLGKRVYEAAQKPATEQPATPAADWEQSGAYSHKAGAIQWADGYAAIKQFAESATGHEDDSRFMHETLDAIHAIAAQEVENTKTVTVGTDTLEHARVLIDEMNKQHAALQAENARLKAALADADSKFGAIQNNAEYAMRPDDKQMIVLSDKKVLHEIFMLAVRASGNVMRAMNDTAPASVAVAGRDSEVGT